MSFHCCTGCDASLTSLTHTAGPSPSLGEWYLTLHGVTLHHLPLPLYVQQTLDPLDHTHCSHVCIPPSSSVLYDQNTVSCRCAYFITVPLLFLLSLFSHLFHMHIWTLTFSSSLSYCPLTLANYCVKKAHTHPRQTLGEKHRDMVLRGGGEEGRAGV